MSLTYAPNQPSPVQPGIGFGTWILLLLVVTLVSATVAVGVLMAAGVVPLPFSGTPGHVSDEDQVREAAMNLFSLMKQGRLEEAADFAMPEDRQEILASGAPPAWIEFSAGEVTFYDDGHASVEIHATDTNTGEVETRPIHLARHEGRWKVSVRLTESAGPEHGGSAAGSNRTIDAMNLKRLMECYLVGQAQAKALRTPRSEGRLFWLALCVGDGPGAGNVEIMGLDDPDMYIRPEDAARLLVSPDDTDALGYDEIVAQLKATIEAGAGVHGLANPELMCSYAGPVDPRKTLRDRSAPIVGCTGMRDGVPIFWDGFNAVRANCSVEWLEWDFMVHMWGWPEGTDQPLYGTDPLQHVKE